MRFAQALDLAPGDVVALIGAGGKTALMVSMGYELAEAGWRVLATATTKISAEQLRLFPCAMPANTDARAISQALSDNQFVLLYDRISGEDVFGPAPDWTRQLLDSVDSDICWWKPIMQLADRSKRRWRANRESRRRHRWWWRWRR